MTGRGRGSSRRGRNTGNLKTKTEILKKRRLKEFQDARRKLRGRRRKMTGGQKGKGPRTGATKQR